jgi:hypothetical protein
MISFTLHGGRAGNEPNQLDNSLELDSTINSLNLVHGLCLQWETFVGLLRCARQVKKHWPLDNEALRILSCTIYPSSFPYSLSPQCRFEAMRCTIPNDSKIIRIWARTATIHCYNYLILSSHLFRFTLLKESLVTSLDFSKI